MSRRAGQRPGEPTHPGRHREHQQEVNRCREGVDRHCHERFAYDQLGFSHQVRNRDHRDDTRGLETRHELVEQAGNDPHYGLLQHDEPHRVAALQAMRAYRLRLSVVDALDPAAVS